jgi:O-succinylbenzoate synthase
MTITGPQIARAAAEVDLSTARVFAIPMIARFRGITVREGVLVQGPAGWGEFCPFAEYDDQVAASWLATAVESAVLGWPAAVRDRIPTRPSWSPRNAPNRHGIRLPDGQVRSPTTPSWPRAAPAWTPSGSSADAASGRRRWPVDVDTAVVDPRLDSGGLQYVEQPCRTIEELAAVRRRVQVPIAADESIRRAEDPLKVAVAGAADIAVIKCTPLGGVRRSLEVAAAAGLPSVVSSALETSVGLAAQLALAGALPQMSHACGLGTLSLLKSDLVAGPESLRPVDGYLPVPSAPPRPDPGLLDTYAMVDPERVTWWTDRLHRAYRLLTGR